MFVCFAYFAKNNKSDESGTDQTLATIYTHIPFVFELIQTSQYTANRQHIIPVSVIRGCCVPTSSLSFRLTCHRPLWLRHFVSGIVERHQLLAVWTSAPAHVFRINASIMRVANNLDITCKTQVSGHGFRMGLNVHRIMCMRKWNRTKNG